MFYNVKCLLCWPIQRWQLAFRPQKARCNHPSAIHSDSLQFNVWIGHLHGGDIHMVLCFALNLEVSTETLLECGIYGEKEDMLSLYVVTECCWLASTVSICIYATDMHYNYMSHVATLKKSHYNAPILSLFVSYTYICKERLETLTLADEALGRLLAEPACDYLPRRKAIFLSQGLKCHFDSMCLPTLHRSRLLWNAPGLYMWGRPRMCS